LFFASSAAVDHRVLEAGFSVRLTPPYYANFSKSRRTIQLPAVCRAALAHHKADQDLERKFAGSRWKETGYVFTTRIGTPIDARGTLLSFWVTRK
jgi:hypothetical protein